MKCLFCGKVLPLLKRLAGAEFCSDEHRQQYRQEYSALALSRLAQQKSDALGNAAGDLAGTKVGLPTKPQPAAEQASTPRSLPPSPSMKLTETKADARKSGPRSLTDAKSGAAKSPEQKGSEPKAFESKITATQAASPKPALVTRPGRPPLTPTPVAPASMGAEPVRGEPKRLPITAASAKPVRSVVPLQETKSLRVTETRAAETDSKAPEVKTSEVKIAEAKIAEPARPSRSSAHTPLRLELPVGPAVTPGPRHAPERRVVATPQADKSTRETPTWEKHKRESPAATVEQAASADMVPQEPVLKAPIHKEPEQDIAGQAVAEQDAGAARRSGAEPAALRGLERRCACG